MFCSVKSKEVNITKALEVKDPKGNVCKNFYDCSGNYTEIAGMKVHIICDGSKNENCLLRKM